MARLSSSTPVYLRSASVVDDGNAALFPVPNDGVARQGQGSSGAVDLGPTHIQPSGTFAPSASDHLNLWISMRGFGAVGLTLLWFNDQNKRWFEGETVTATGSGESNDILLQVTNQDYPLWIRVNSLTNAGAVTDRSCQISVSTVRTRSI